MKFIKLKSIMLLGTGILLGSIGVSATSYFSARDVSFTPSDTSWDVDNAEDAFNDLYTINDEISAGKNLIADAITNKGVTTSNTASFSTMANNISNIGSAKSMTINSSMGWDYHVNDYKTLPNLGWKKITCTSVAGTQYLVVQGNRIGTGSVVDVSSAETITIQVVGIDNVKTGVNYTLVFE